MTFNFAMQALDQIVNSAAKTNYMSEGKLTVQLYLEDQTERLQEWLLNIAKTLHHCVVIPGLKVIQPFSAEDKGSLRQQSEKITLLFFLKMKFCMGSHFL